MYLRIRAADIHDSSTSVLSEICEMTKPELILQMRRVSDAMISLGNDMSAYGVRNNEVFFHNHGTELSGAGRILANWQDAAEKEENGYRC